MPLYPRRSPRPPATSTNAALPISSIPAFSSSRCSSEAYSTTTPSGTDGVHPSNGFTPSLLSLRSFFAFFTYAAIPPG